MKIGSCVSCFLQVARLALRLQPPGCRAWAPEHLGLPLNAAETDFGCREAVPQPPHLRRHQKPELKGSTAVHLVWPSATAREGVIINM